MNHVSGLVAAATMGHRREIGRIGLHQQPVHRHVAGDGAHLLGVLERQDARKRDVEADLQRSLGDGAARAEAVDDAGEGPLPRLLAKDAAGVLVRGPRVHDERQPGLPRRRDMLAKTGLLLRPRAVVVVEIQPGFANPDHLRMLRHPNQVVGRHLRLLGDVVRMDPDRAPNRFMSLGQAADRIELGHPRADGLQGADPGLRRARKHAIEIVAEVGEVEMAVAVNQHLHTRLSSQESALSSTNRGKIGAGLGNGVPGARRPSGPSAAR